MSNKEQEQELHNQAYTLRLSGKTYRDIGKIMGIGHGTAERWCKAHMDSVSLPLIDDIRKTEVDRLLRCLDRLEDRADEGDDKAISLIIKISESLRKLLGVDVPVVSTVEHVEVSAMDMDIRALIDAQKNLNAERLSEAAKKGLGSEQD